MNRIDRKLYAGPVIWTLVLGAIFFMDPADGSSSLCLFKFLGFNSCAGCGLGHSIHEALHFNFPASFQHHWLGIPVTVSLIYCISKPFFSLKNTNQTWTSKDGL